MKNKKRTGKERLHKVVFVLNPLGGGPNLTQNMERGGLLHDLIYGSSKLEGNSRDSQKNQITSETRLTLPLVLRPYPLELKK